MEPPSAEAQPAPKPEQPLFGQERHKSAPHPVDSTPLVVKNAPPPLIWKWPTFGAADYVVAATGGAITLAAAIVKPRSQHSLSGGLWFDNDVRSALRAKTLATRYTFRESDRMFEVERTLESAHSTTSTQPARPGGAEG